MEGRFLPTGDLELGNTILKAGASGANIFNSGGTVTSHGYNVCSDNGSGFLNGPGDQINTDPMLGPLQDNGGPTLTHALLPGSPAIDAGDPNFTPPPYYDQRGPGFVRVFNGRIDVGSFEVQPTPTPTPTPTSDTHANSDTDSYSHSNCNCYCYPYFDTETFTDAKTGANSQAASHSATAPIAIMKKKHTAQFAFPNLRVLIGLLVALTSVILALLGFGVFAIHAANTTQTQQSYTTRNSIDPLVPPGFDCSKIHELGIDKQMNFRAGAIMIFCGEAQGGSASPVGTFSRFVQKLPEPLVYGTTDVDLITGTETYPHIDQSTTFSWGNPDNPDQIVVAYNDIRGSGSGASVSTDGGLTFTRLTKANGQSPFPNTGDPVVLV